jgi:hypothetical protein
LNGISFTSTSAFTDLAFATYTVQIKDSIGCIQSATANVNALSNLPQANFLASTKNFVSDTIVLVDISLPQPDSIHWTLPPSAIKVGGDMFNPIIVINDTGTFNITLKGYFGDCIIYSTKLIRFGQLDSTIANHYNASGIKSCVLFPNPNNGNFTVQIELYKKQNVSVQVWNTSPTKFFQQNYYETNLITLPLSLTQLQNGTYMLRIIAEYDSISKSFIISK